MPEYISGRPDLVKTLIEDMLFHCGVLKLKKDGKGLVNPKVYTREYQVYMPDGKRTNASVKFIYDQREETAEIKMVYYDFLELKLQQRIQGLSNERIQISDAQRDKPTRAIDEEAPSFGDSQVTGGLPDSI